MNTRTISIGQAAKILGVARLTAYRAAHKGEIPVIKIGDRLLVPVAKLNAMLGIGNTEEV